MGTVDPNANLREQLVVARQVTGDTGDYNWAPANIEADLERLASLVVALDEWIRKGGFVPERWQRTGVA